ncbi:MAG: PAS domain S-box protein, partial [Dehalococcoidia bacterium]
MKAKHNSPGSSIDSSPNSLRKRTEEEALNLKPQLESILGITGISLDIIDSNFNVVYVDSAWAQIYGNRAGRKCYEYFRGRSEICPNCGAKKALETKSPVVTERTLENERNTRFQATSIPFQNGKGEWFVAEVRVDVTERKRAAQKHQAILETALDGFLIADLEARLLEVNDSYCKMVGYTREELLTKSIPDLEAAERPEETAQHIRKIMEQGYDWFETQHQCKDGKIIDVEVSSNHIDADGGQMVAFVHDITERKRTEQALRESEGKYRTLVENIPQKIFLKDKNSVYISCNSNYAGDLKMKAEEIPGHTDYDFYPRDLAEKYRADDQRIAESGQTQRIEERYIQQGQERLVETFKTPVRDESGKLVGVLGIFRDITEQREMERRRRGQEVAEVRAEELSESRRRLIDAQEFLRKEIAGQLHGTVQNRLILLGHKLAELEAKPASERTTGELASIRRRIEELQNDHIRPIGHRLFPSILRLGISAGLESLVDEYSTELHVDLQVSKRLRDRELADRQLIPDNVRLALYRIAEEALAN